jgi:TusA-related sulfurtransferase
VKGGDKVTKKVLLSLMVVLAVGFFIGLTTYACGNNGHNGKDCPMGMKDAKFEVNKIDNGITITITSDKPEVVKQIQEHQANCKKDCQHNGMKDAKVEVNNLDNGVSVKITSDNPEVVKQIQEHQANCLKNGNKECAKKCQELHKTGKCPGH